MGSLSVEDHLAALVAEAAAAAGRATAARGRVNEAQDWSRAALARLDRAQAAADRARVRCAAAHALVDVGVDPRRLVAVAHVTDPLPTLTVGMDGQVTNAWAYLEAFVCERITAFGFDPALAERSHAAGHGFVVPVVGVAGPDRIGGEAGHVTLATGTRRGRDRMVVGAWTFTHGGDHHEDLVETSFAEWVAVTEADGEPLRWHGTPVRSAHTVIGCDHCGTRSRHPRA